MLGNDEIVHRYFAAVNAENWRALAGLWREDAELRATGARSRSGRAEIMGFYKKLFDPWRVHLDDPVRILPCGDATTVEVRFTGTTHNGMELSFDAVDVFDFADGGIARLTNWYDVAFVRKALAQDAAPAAPGRA